MSGQVLGSERYSALAVLWVLAFTAAPGFFQPLEQEIARAIAARRARNTGSAPVIQRGALTGGLIAAGLVVVIIIAALVSPLVDSLFKGQTLLVVALTVMLVGYFAEHMTRGVLAGNGQLVPTACSSAAKAAAPSSVVPAVIGAETAGRTACSSQSPVAAAVHRAPGPEGTRGAGPARSGPRSRPTSLPRARICLLALLNAAPSSCSCSQLQSSRRAGSSRACFCLAALFFFRRSRRRWCLSCRTARGWREAFRAGRASSRSP